MPTPSFNRMACRIARSLERVCECWTILRDALAGTTRFDAFQKSLGIAPNILTRRLAALAEAGMLERHRYSAHPPRDEYRLTDCGRDFQTVLTSLLAFGNQQFSPDGPTVMLVDADTGQPADPILVDRRTGRPLIGPRKQLVLGPAATEATVTHLATRRATPLPALASKERTA